MKPDGCKQTVIEEVILTKEKFESKSGEAVDSVSAGRNIVVKLH